MKQSWYFCTGCGVVLKKGEARAFGCGDEWCSGSLRWLDMSADEYKTHKPLLEVIGVKEFAKRVRYGELR